MAQLRSVEEFRTRLLDADLPVDETCITAVAVRLDGRANPNQTTALAEIRTRLTFNAAKLRQSLIPLPSASLILLSPNRLQPIVRCIIDDGCHHVECIFPVPDPGSSFAERRATHYMNCTSDTFFALRHGKCNLRRRRAGQAYGPPAQ